MEGTRSQGVGEDKVTATRPKLVDEDELHALLERTAAFHEDLVVLVQTLAPIPDDRSRIAFQAASLAVEHSLSILMLIQAGNFASSIALMRPQFESVLRAVWLLHVAPAGWVGKLSTPLTQESARKANKLPRIGEMLTQLEADEDVEPRIVEQLRGFETTLLGPLSSFTHGGAHALARLASGYTAQLLYDAMLNSNAVTSFAAQLLVISDGRGRMPILKALHDAHAGCFNIINTSSVR